MASLHIAVLFGDEKLTRSLLDDDEYDVNAYDKLLGTPLSIAVLKGYRSIVKLLHERGADHNTEQFTNALIHSSLDSLQLPVISTDKSRANSYLKKAKESDDKRMSDTVRQADIENAKNDYENASGDSGNSSSESENASSDSENASSKSENLPPWPGGVIKTLYTRNGKLQDPPTGPEMKSSPNPIGETQGRCSIAVIVELSDESEWSVRQIEIRGPKLCRFISRVLEEYPGASYHQSKIILNTTTVEMVDTNFIGLFHRSEDYIRLCKEEVDDATRGQAELLLQCLEPLWQTIRGLVEASKVTGLMEYGHLWAVYRLEEVVLIQSDNKTTNKLSAAKLKGVRLAYDHREKVYEMKLIYRVVDWNGFSTGYKEGSYLLNHYDGLKKINMGGVFPISYASEPDEIQKKLVKRGRKFESLRGYFFMTRKEFKIDRRVIIDNYAYHRFQQGYFPGYTALNDKSRSTVSDYEFDSDEMPFFASTMTDFRTTPGERDMELPPLTDDECLLCVPIMHGFDIQEKKWSEVEVEGLDSVTWNDQAFTHLTMQEDQKRLILAFARQKQVEDTKFDDFIAGKGKSLIILLCGPPGVGKTLTAESTAERSRAPLYMLSAGDLGTDASSVERSLKKALDLCSHWKAFMLIDEADVFLETRKTDNLKRNELVSVFLRLLEYYDGILFLTTNRAATIDTAFESRIDLIIPYEELDMAARRQVWGNFVKNMVATTHELSDTDLDELGQQKLNGREIKSLVKTALMLAASEGQTLQMQHINVVLNVRQRAADYLHGEA